MNPRLHDESATLYRLLRDAGEVTRLNLLDHLGTIRMAWEGAHHPRWEYVVSILHLVDRCASPETPEVHLKSRVSLGGVRISSGAELLKCWALLSNLGHLNGTFAMERALLFSLSPQDRADLLNLLDEDVRPWAEDVIDSVRVYRFFQVLGFVQLEDLMASHRLPVVHRRRWRAVYRSFVSAGTSTEQIDSLRDIYRNIRRLAFLALDSHYTPAVTRLDLARIMSDPRRLSSLVLQEADGNDDLRGLEQFLTREIYLGRPVLRVIARHESRVEGYMRTSLQRNRDLLRTMRMYWRARPSDLLSLAEQDYEPVTRLPVWVSPPFDRLVLRRVDVRAEQAKADAWAAARKRDVKTVVWTAAYSDEWVLQTHALPDATIHRAAAWRYAFEEAVALHTQLVSEWARWTPNADNLVQEALFGSLARELIESALRVCFRTEARWEFVDLRRVSTAQFHTRKHIRNVLAASANLGATSRDDERFGVSQVLKWRPNQYVVMTTPIEAFNAEGRVKMAEFDGVLVEPRGEAGLKVTFIEVKRESGGTARSSAERALRNKLHKFALNEEVLSKPMSTGRISDLAWAATELSVR